MNITSKTAIRIETTIDLVVSVDEVPYRFRIIQSETQKRTVVREISFLDKWQVKLQPSLRKKIEQHIRENFNCEAR